MSLFKHIFKIVYCLCAAYSATFFRGKKNKKCSIILASIMTVTFACSPQPAENQISSSRNHNVGDDNLKNADQSADGEEGQDDEGEKEEDNTPQYIKRPKVSAFFLDDQSFQVTRLAIGLQSYLDSESPLLNFKIPEMADYVEILRCPVGIVLISGTSPIKISDLEISGLSDDEKAQAYRSNDYFKAGEQAGCELLTDGSADETFYDSFSPDGSYRYMVRACVTPSRLMEKEKLSNRNCSKQVAFSSILSDYENKRGQKAKKALRMASIYASRIDQVANSMKVLAETANQALIDWENEEHQRKVDKKIKDAWLTIAAVIVEVAFEFKTIPAKGTNIFKYYATFWKSPQKFMDMTQLLQAAQGYMLADTFKKIAYSSADMPRTASRYKKIVDQYSTLESTLSDAMIKYGYYYGLAELAKTGQVLVDGEEVSIPDVNSIREFQALQSPTQAEAVAE